MNMHSMCGSRKVSFTGGPIFDNFFLVDKGIEDPNTAINGPLSARSAKRHCSGPMMAY